MYWRKLQSSSRGLKKGLVEDKCPFYHVSLSTHFTKSLKKQHLYSVSFQWEIGIQLLLLLLKTLNKPHKLLVLSHVLFLTWKKSLNYRPFQKIRDFIQDIREKYMCLFKKLMIHIFFSFLFLDSMPQFPTFALFRRRAVFQQSLFCLTWTFLFTSSIQQRPWCKRPRKPNSPSPVLSYWIY